ncbi:MAG: hypothetical protein SVT56_12405 [Chloroflexota bacterium]|nr:hypothetical protein [Chloroflexota bacterium]
MKNLPTLTRLDREVLDFIVETVRAEQQVTAIEVEEAILDAFGMMVRLRTSGRELGVVQLDYTHLGVPEDSARRKKLRAPRMDLLPKDSIDAITAIFARARSTLERQGVSMTYRRIVWVPMQRWEELRKEILELRREVEVIVDTDILARYQDILNDNLYNAEKKAIEAYDALSNAGATLEEERKTFIDRFVKSVELAFPSYENIAANITLSLETTRPAPAHLVSAVVEAKKRYFENQEEAIEETRMREIVRRDARLLWEAQVQPSVLDELTVAAGGELLEALLEIVDHKGAMTSGLTRKVKSRLGKYSGAAGFIASTQQLDDYLKCIEQALNIRSSQRNTNSLLALVQKAIETMQSLTHRPFDGIGKGLIDISILEKVRDNHG